MQFFEVGDDNDLLYNLYSVMCDVYVVVVDTTNLTGGRDSLQLIQKIRATSPSAGMLNHTNTCLVSSKRSRDKTPMTERQHKKSVAFHTLAFCPWHSDTLGSKFPIASHDSYF